MIGRARSERGPICFRIPLLLLAVCVSFSRPPASQAEPIRDKPLTLLLALQREIIHQQGIPLPNALRWIPDNVLALDNTGTRLLILLPVETTPEMKRRYSDDLAARSYRLAWIDLSGASVGPYRVLEYWPGQGLPPLLRKTDAGFDIERQPTAGNFGFVMSPDRDLICTISRSKVFILSRELEDVWEFPTHLSDLGNNYYAVSCNFSADGRHCSILYWQQADRITRTLLVLYDLGAGTQHSFSFNTLVSDLAILEFPRAVMINREPRWLYRYRVSEFILDSGMEKPLWKTHVTENGGQRLVFSPQFMFRAERDSINRGEDGGGVVSSRGFYDSDSRSPARDWPVPGIIGTIRSWRRESAEKGPSFSLDDYVLHWPVAVSADGRLLVSRATHFDRLEGNFTLWDDERFVVFDVANPNRLLYISENFGTNEAIMGIAFSPDRSMLVVATTTRLLIYEIKEAPAKQ